MAGDGLRSFKPDQLERLAGLMDNLETSTGEVFTRASSLQVSHLVGPLRELPGWTTGNARDLRRRAAIGRLKTGDPFAGLAWAGFSPMEIAANGDKIDPTTLVYVNTVADWAAETGHGEYTRKSHESMDDYLKRLEAAAIAKVIPDLKPHEATVAKVLEGIGDASKVMQVAPITIAQGTALSRLLLNNKVWQPLATRIAGLTKMTEGRVPMQIRSATAPGTGLGNLTRNLFMRSSLYRDYVAMLPEYMEMDRVGNAVNAGRAMAGLRVNQFIDLVFGNNKLAQALGGTTHSGQAVKLSGQANLLRVWAATANPAKMEAAAAILKVEPAALSRVGALTKAAGGLRVLGVAGSAASTVYSGVNVVSQGNPVDAFKRNGAGYVADVAELGFNASLTAALVCPNPVTIGATVVFGAVYVGAKVIEHWDDVKDGAAKAVDAVGSGLKKAGSFVKSLNPFG